MEFDQNVLSLPPTNSTISLELKLPLNVRISSQLDRIELDKTKQINSKRELTHSTNLHSANRSGFG